MTETTVETTVAERPAAHRSEKRQGDGAWTPEASTGRWFAAGWEPAARVVLVGLLAGSLGLAARSVGPAPFAPETREVVVGYLLSMLAAAPALFFARRTLVSNVFLAAPFVLLVENLGSLVDRSAPEHVLLALTGVLLGLAALRIRSPRALAGLSALALFVFGVGRFRPIDPLAASQTPSVLLVVFDTTAAGHVSAYGYSRPTTPNLAGLARRGLVYERAVAAAPWTLPSHGAIFSGRYPSELGFREDGFDPRFASGSIAEDLAASGRPGCAISANPWIPESRTLGRGFGAVWDVVHLIKSFPLRVLDRVRHRWGYHGQGMRVTRLALDWVDRLAPRGEPWLLFVNYLDPHAPYTPPARERQRFASDVEDGSVADDSKLYNSGTLPLTPEVRAAMGALYDGEVAAMDRAFGRLIGGLAERGYGQRNLIVIVVSDHGESLGEHGLVGHLLGMNDQLLHVPLLVAGPGIQPGRVAAPVQSVQLRATVRSLLGLPPLSDIAPPLPPWGQPPSLLISERAQTDWYFGELREVRPDIDVRSWSGNWVAVERDGTKVVFDDQGRGATYDLQSDPGELAPRPLADGAALVEAYQQWRQWNPTAENPAPQHRRSLRSLGYVM